MIGLGGVSQLIGIGIDRLAHRQHVLNRSARQRRTACDFNIPTSIPVRRFAVALGPLPSTVFSAIAGDARTS